MLVGPDGGEARTWQQDYPYQQRISREEYVGLNATCRLSS
jgi:hypothetical protein